MKNFLIYIHFSTSWYSEQGDSDSSEFLSSESDGLSTKNKKYVKRKHKTKRNSSSSYESDEDNKRLVLF